MYWVSKIIMCQLYFVFWKYKWMLCCDFHHGFLHYNTLDSFHVMKTKSALECNKEVQSYLCNQI